MKVEATGMPVLLTNSLSSGLASRQPPPTYKTGLRAYTGQHRVVTYLLSTLINSMEC